MPAATPQGCEGRRSGDSGLKQLQLKYHPFRIFQGTYDHMGALSGSPTWLCKGGALEFELQQLHGKSTSVPIGVGRSFHGSDSR